MDKLTIACIVCLAFIAVIVIAMKFIVRRDEKMCRCCGYCTYWFKCESRLGGRCAKHSTASMPFYTQWEDSCVHYDGFAPEE